MSDNEATTEVVEKKAAKAKASKPKATKEAKPKVTKEKTAKEKPAKEAKAKAEKKPAKEKAAKPEKAAKAAKPKAEKKPAKEKAPTDKFGFRVDSLKSKAATIYSTGKGATLAEVKEQTGSSQLNLLKELEARGFEVRKSKEDGPNKKQVTRYKVMQKKKEAA